jgi:5-formyltetrahydrofolate cyclo-ligase
MDSNETQQERQKVMRRVQSMLDAMPDRIHAQNSFHIADKLIKHQEFQRATVVGIFVGYGGEVDTVRLMEAALTLGKRVAAPATDIANRRIVWREIKDPNAEIDLGPIGIPQPLPTCREMHSSSLELITVPGLVWDERGRRLSRWQGYFDRFLAHVPRSIFRVGLAFDLQVVEDLSNLVGATLVSALLTEDEVRRFGPMDAPRQSTGRRLPGGPSGYK